MLFFFESHKEKYFGSVFCPSVENTLENIFTIPADFNKQQPEQFSTQFNLKHRFISFCLYYLHFYAVEYFLFYIAKSTWLVIFLRFK